MVGEAAEALQNKSLRSHREAAGAGFVPLHWKVADRDDRTAYLTGGLTASRKTRWGHVGNAPAGAPDSRPSVSVRHCNRACVARSDRRPERCAGGRAPCPASREARGAGVAYVLV